MNVTLLRHATLLVRISGKNLLVDPMLSQNGAMPPISNSPNDLRNPLVPLPEFDPDSTDAVLVTHTHPDHFDEAAAEVLLSGVTGDVPIFCQPEDEETLRSSGLVDVRPVTESLSWEGIDLHRTGGQHGTGEIGAKMAPVSGFVLQSSSEEPILYIAGDTIWCHEVEVALDRYHPNVVVVNAGAAQFVTGDPITMTAEDVARVCRYAPEAKIVAVHMEAINHCLLTRAELRTSLADEGLTDQVLVPGDGERMEF